jgi:drug/metabolite transporter (DMT)-like permease
MRFRRNVVWCLIVFLALLFVLLTAVFQRDKLQVVIWLSLLFVVAGGILFNSNNSNGRG